MGPTEYVFHIDAFTPDTLPMGRLAEYLSALAELIGHAEHTHFVRVEPGSAQLVHKVDAVDAPKVEARLYQVRAGNAPREALKAQRELENLLANDNALGTLTERDTGKVVVPFVGRNRPKPIAFPPFRENATIQGQIVSVGGRDNTAHAQVQDGDVIHTNLSMSRDTAKKLAQLLYGPIVRLYGSGRFERQPDGVWKMLTFQVDRFERLDDQTVGEALADIRQIKGNRLMEPDSYWNVRRSEQSEGDEG